MDVRLCAPKKCWPESSLIDLCKDMASQTGAEITLTENAEEGVKDADFLYTDVWVSMGEPEEVWEERIKLLKPYQVNMDVIKLTGNPNVKFMHCMPAFHNRETKVGEEIYSIYGLELFESNNVFRFECLTSLAVIFTIEYPLPPH